MSGKLYQLERSLLQERADMRHYRYDLVNTLNGGVVLSAFSTSPIAPLKLVQRCSQLNEVWSMTKPVPHGNKVERITLDDAVGPYNPYNPYVSEY